jgi:hypothetical protein
LETGNHQEAEQAEETVQIEELSPPAVATKAKRKVKRKTKNQKQPPVEDLSQIRKVIIPRKKKRSRMLLIAFNIQPFQPIQVMCESCLFLQVKVQRRKVHRRKAPRRIAPRRKVHLGKERLKNGKKTIVKKKK